MPQYRFYAVADDGHFDRPAQVYDLPDDDAAKAKARQLVDGRDVEVWQQSRLVARVVKIEN